MKTYKLIGVIAIAAVLGTACKKEVSKPEAEPALQQNKVDQIPNKCGVVWYDRNGGGHWIPCKPR